MGGEDLCERRREKGEDQRIISEYTSDNRIEVDTSVPAIASYKHTCMRRRGEDERLQEVVTGICH